MRLNCEEIVQLIESEAAEDWMILAIERHLETCRACNYEYNPKFSDNNSLLSSLGQKAPEKLHSAVMSEIKGMKYAEKRKQSTFGAIAGIITILATSIGAVTLLKIFKWVKTFEMDRIGEYFGRAITYIISIPGIKLDDILGVLSDQSILNVINNPNMIIAVLLFGSLAWGLGAVGIKELYIRSK